MERTIKKIVFPVQEAPKLTRVAAYARVSSGKDAMLHSLILLIGTGQLLQRPYSASSRLGILRCICR